MYKNVKSYYIRYENLDIKTIKDLLLPRTVKAYTVKNSQYKIADLIMAFDIETSRLDYTGKEMHSFMYHWQFNIFSKYTNTNTTIIGRYWEDFVKFLDLILDVYPARQYIVYVHNLSFEFQFMKSFIEFSDVFALSTRKILYCTYRSRVQFRCSKELSNMSLDMFTKRYCHENFKLVGDLDYRIIRYPTSKLSYNELQYCINDVVSLCEAIYNLLEQNGDTLATVPYTSTGYVRRDIRNAIKESNILWEHVEVVPDDVYYLLRKAFRGGNVHANSLYVDELLHDISSVDRASSYPTEMLNKKYPYNFKEKKDVDFDRLLHIAKRGKACLVEFRCLNLIIKPDIYCPYLSSSKVFEPKNMLKDNKRVISFDSGILCMTDIDLKIFVKHYDFESVEILKCYTAQYDYLPKPVTDCIKEYYNAKTSLKGVKGQEEYYMKSKNKLNSIYGMTVTNPQKPDYLYNRETQKISQTEPEISLHKALLTNKRNYSLSYAVGVWVTAYARYELQLLIDAIGIDFVYCDTDSVKYLNNHDDEVEKYNERLSKSKLKAVDPQGVKHIGGIFESEGIYEDFKTLGSKKYCYKYHDGEIELTCAGAPKYCAKELSSVDEFEEGVVFDNAGLGHKYEDLIHPILVTYEEDGEQHKLLIGSNISLYPATYEVSTYDYVEILKFFRERYNEVKDGFRPLNFNEEIIGL